MQVAARGTAKSDDIATVRTKMANIFATRFMPDLEPETLRRYLHDKLNLGVTCPKIETGRSRFASFKVSAECNDRNVFLNPDLWPEGTFVIWYYEPRKGQNQPAAVLPVHQAVDLAPAVMTLITQ